MKVRSFLRILFIMVCISDGFDALANPQITYAGGDGSSLEKAIIIKGATEATGVHAEYEYLAKHYPGYKRGRQSLSSNKGRAYDVLEFTTADGRKMVIFFDITEFFGK